MKTKKIRDDAQYRNEQLSTVRQAIELFIPGFKNLRIRRSPLRMTVEKKGVVFNIKQLSDGEKCLIAMVGDIARRLAMANPSADNALKGEGVILIDEIDLHLHPSWQRMVIDRLSSTFPNCQFILSTHSPQIIGHVKPNSVWLLSSEKGDVTAAQPENTFGMDSNLILECIMEVPERELGIKTKLMDLFKFINEGDSNMTQKTLSEIIQIAGDLPELNRAKALIKRKELLGK
ncbi:MAG: AAA family ATPase [Methylococcaceae bacterium]|nr:AAA family ATPase [Methylococcaceae bacterium]